MSYYIIPTRQLKGDMQIWRKVKRLRDFKPSLTEEEYAVRRSMNYKPRDTWFIYYNKEGKLVKSGYHYLYIKEDDDTGWLARFKNK